MPSEWISETDREEESHHRKVMAHHKELVNSYRELRKKREELLRLGRTQTQQRIFEYRKQMEAIDAYATHAVVKEEEVQAARQQVTMNAASEIASSWIGHVTTMADVTRSMFQATLGELSSGIANGLVEGTHDWHQAMKNVLKVMIRMVIRMMVMQAIARSIGNALGGPMGFMFHAGGAVLHKGGQVPRHHFGEIIRHNEVPAILERGEFVVNRRAVSKPGALRALQAINEGRQIEGATIVQDVRPHYTFNINAIDAENMECTVSERIIPLLEEAQRRGAYEPQSKSS